MIIFRQNSGKFKVTYSDRKQMGRCRWQRVEGVLKGASGGDRYVHWFDCGDGFAGVYLWQNILHCTLQILYVTYTSAKMFKKSKDIHTAF